MNVEAIYVIKDNKFGKAIAEWAESLNIELFTVAQHNEELSNSVDGIVLFHENHNFNKEDDETQLYLNNDNKMIHKVDLNGTLSATNSNFNMWMDRNRLGKLLFLGSDSVAKNENLSKFLEGIEK